jgi:hypothetical protein
MMKKLLMYIGIVLLMILSCSSCSKDTDDNVIRSLPLQSGIITDSTICVDLTSLSNVTGVKVILHLLPSKVDTFTSVLLFGQFKTGITGCDTTATSDCSVFEFSLNMKEMKTKALFRVKPSDNYQSYRAEVNY